MTEDPHPTKRWRMFQIIERTKCCLFNPQCQDIVSLAIQGKVRDKDARVIDRSMAINWSNDTGNFWRKWLPYPSMHSNVFKKRYTFLLYFVYFTSLEQQHSNPSCFWQSQQHRTIPQNVSRNAIPALQTLPAPLACIRMPNMVFCSV